MTVFLKTPEKDLMPERASHDMRTAPDTPSILKSLGEVVYEWDIEKDVLWWGEGADRVFGSENLEKIASGKGYARLLDPENVTNRYDAIVNTAQLDSGAGVSFEIMYRVFPDESADGRRVWLEDTGRWFAGRNGRPARAHGIVRVVNERVQRDQRLAFLSRYDELTGQFNRGRLIEILDETLNDAKSFKRSFALAVAAVDNLKFVNEAYGFDVADQVISEVARKLKSALRYGDAIGRLSGNKFGIVLMDCTAEDFSIAAKRLTSIIRDEVTTTEAGSLAATISLGGVIMPAQANNPQQGLVCAHEALGMAKKQGPGHSALFQLNLDNDRHRRDNMLLSEEIVNALNERRLALAYQPVVDVKTGKLVFEEALLRLWDRHNALITAGRFVPLAEKLGFIRMLDQRAMTLAIDDLKDNPSLTLSLNVSNETISEPGWFSMLSSTIATYPALAERLIVEITETTAIRDLRETCRFVAMVRDLGVRVAIDDFGAGYTSFGNLKHLAVDFVKIDGHFVRNMHMCNKDQVFVRTIVDLARTFAAKTVAEWVTSKETADMLADFKVDYMQGEYSGLATLSPDWRQEKQNESKLVS